MLAAFDRVTQDVTLENLAGPWLPAADQFESPAGPSRVVERTDHPPGQYPLLRAPLLVGATWRESD